MGPHCGPYYVLHIIHTYIVYLLKVDHWGLPQGNWPDPIIQDINPHTTNTTKAANLQLPLPGNCTGLSNRAGWQQQALYRLPRDCTCTYWITAADCTGLLSDWIATWGLPGETEQEDYTGCLQQQVTYVRTVESAQGLSQNPLTCLHRKDDKSFFTLPQVRKRD